MKQQRADNIIEFPLQPIDLDRVRLDSEESAVVIQFLFWRHKRLRAWKRIRRWLKGDPPQNTG